MIETMSKNDYAKSVSLFLAELLRTRKINLKRAADIAQKVVQNINLIDTERHFLQFVKELASDFEELFPFEELVHLHIHSTDRRDLEHKVRLFVAHIMSSDQPQALNLLQESLRNDVTSAELYAKFPQFRQFTERNIEQWNKTV